MKGAQLALGLFATPRADFDEFLGPTNALPRQALQAWSAGQPPWCAGLWGAEGSGKTHLLQAAIKRAHALNRTAMYLPLAELWTHGPSILEGLEQVHALALDDLQAAAGDPAWEEGLFDLWNRCQAAGCFLLYALREGPAAQPFRLADLGSRLQSALIFHVLETPEDEKPALLCALAARRGLELGLPVASFLLRRLPRGLKPLVAALDELDQHSLREGRALTVPFVREVLRLGDQ